MTTYFISDLHLSPNRPEISDRFIRFLEGDLKNEDALYILGDLFDLWVGDEQISTHDQAIIQALARLHKQGVPLYFMPGNRDFLVGQTFINQSGCTLLTDPTRITLYGQNVLIMHGDTLCTHDKQYQYFRKIVRTPLAQELFHKIPFSWRLGIAHLMRRYSTRHQAADSAADAPPAIAARYDVALDAVYSVLRQYNCQLLIHGHTHKPNIHSFILDGHGAKRMVLGDWQMQGSTILVYSLDGPTLKILS